MDRVAVESLQIPFPARMRRIVPAVESTADCSRIYLLRLVWFDDDLVGHLVFRFR